MPGGRDTRHDPKRQAQNTPAYLDRIPHPASRQVERDAEPEDTTDYEQIHLDRLERRRPEGDTW